MEVPISQSYRRGCIHARTSNNSRNPVGRSRSSVLSAHLRHDFLRRIDVFLRVDFRDRQRLVTEDHLRGFETVFFPQLRGGRVAELVWVPDVLTAPLSAIL